MEKLSRTRKYAELRNSLKNEEKNELTERHDIDVVETLDIPAFDETNTSVNNETEVNEVSQDNKNEELVVSIEDNTQSENLFENTEITASSDSLNINDLLSVDSMEHSIFDNLKMDDELSSLDEFSKTLSLEIEEILKRTSIDVHLPEEDIVPILDENKFSFENEASQDLEQLSQNEKTPLEENKDNVSELDNTTVINKIEELKEEITDEPLDAKKLLSDEEKQELPEEVEDNTTAYFIKKEEEFEAKPNKILNILLIILIIVLVVALLSMVFLILSTRGYI